MVRIAEITGLTPLMNVVDDLRYEDSRATPRMGRLLTFLISLENHDIVQLNHKSMTFNILSIYL